MRWCLVALVVSLWLVSSTALAHHTALHTAATNLSVGTWTQFSSTGVSTAFTGVGGTDGILNPYSSAIRWDPRTHRIYYLGQVHGGDRRAVKYTESTNAWTIMGTNGGGADFPGTYVSVPPDHGFEHLALDWVNGKVLKQEYNGYNSPTKVWRMDIATETWDELATIPTTQILQCCTPIEVWPRYGLLAFNGGDEGQGGGASISRLSISSASPGTYGSSWSVLLAPAALPVVGPKENFLKYCPATEKMFGGGGDDLGNGGNTAIFRLNKVYTNGAMSGLSVTSRATMPAGYDGSNDEMACDPVTGHLLLLHSNSESSSSMYAFNDDTNSWSTLSTPPAGLCSGGALGCFTYTDIGSIDSYGVLFAVSCDSPSTCQMWLYKYTAVNTTAFSAFWDRCAAAGVLTCKGFDHANQIAGEWGTNPTATLPGTGGNATTPAIASDQAASGAGALKFVINSQSGSDGGGAVQVNFSDDLVQLIGASSEFWVSWRQRFNCDFLFNTCPNTDPDDVRNYTSGGGWKQAIIGVGSVPGTPASSCTALETVTQATDQRGFPQMYNSCTGSASHGAFDGFYEAVPPSDFKLQNARATPFCLYSASNADDAFPPNGNCVQYYPDEWVAYKVHILTGVRTNGEFVNSHVDLYTARDGATSWTQLLNWGPYNLTGTGSLAYGAVWLLPYHTNKSSAQTHPTGNIWYDELLVSTQDIAVPGQAASGTVASRVSGNVRFSGSARMQ